MRLYNMTTQAIQIITSASTSMAVSTAVDASPLLTALITLGVSIVTAVGAEFVKYAVAYFKNKTKKLEESMKENEGEDNGKVH